MSSNLSNVTAPRQRGLKKPPPLRSLSYPKASASERLDLVKPLSVESSGHETEVAMASQPSPVCREIAAMSALLVAETGHQEKSPTNMSMQSQSQMSRAAIYHRANSSPSGNPETTRTELQRRYSTEDTFTLTDQYAPPNSNNNNIKVSGENLIQDNEKLHASRKDTPSGIGNSSMPASYTNSKAGSFRNQQVSAVKAAMCHNHSLPPAAVLHDKEDQHGLKSVSSVENGIVVATLKTARGEELIISAGSIPTLICATRVLVNELGAKIEKLEAFPKEDFGDEPKPTEDKRQSPKLSQAHPITDEGTKYSKVELLQISRSVLSKRPPGSWNVLTLAHPEVCLPANTVRQYFDPVDFHPHDGSLFAESSSTRDRRDQRRV